MFSSTATRGAKRSTRLQLEARQPRPRRRRRAPAAGVATARRAASPRLPPTKVGPPGRAHMSPASVVVVILPLVPVIAISVPRHEARRQLDLAGDRHAGRARRRQLGRVGGTPGDSTISSAPVNVSRRCPPSSRAMLAPAAPASAGAQRAPRAPVGHGHARAARRAQLRRRDPGAPEPDHEHAFADSDPSGRLSSHLQGGDEAQIAQAERDDPETHDDSGLRPALFS